jgi:stringent starvation protein A
MTSLSTVKNHVVGAVCGDAIKKSVVNVFCGDSTFSIFAHLIRLSLAYKEIPFVCMELMNADDIKRYAPEGRLPVIMDQGLRLDRWTMIMDYIEERFPYPALMPTYPIMKAKMRIFICETLQAFHPILKQCFLSGQGAKVIQEYLLHWETCITKEGFMLFREFSMADCLIVAILWRIKHYAESIYKKTKQSMIWSYGNRLFDRAFFDASLLETERDSLH